MTTPAHGPRHAYRHVGPPEPRAAVRPGAEAHAIRSPADLDAWVTERGPAGGR
ncbi:hypothetical protein [Streptomyces sp. NPDC057781]|uniref:hypothetical protein n=1 Tax=unclassified Streptomyces TaxID=2593676 RepID=UPI0036C89D16